MPNGCLLHFNLVGHRVGSKSGGLSPTVGRLWFLPENACPSLRVPALGARPLLSCVGTVLFTSVPGLLTGYNLSLKVSKVVSCNSTSWLVHRSTQGQC